MKKINNYIFEKLRINKDSKDAYDPNESKELKYVKTCINDMLEFEYCDDILKDFKQNNSMYKSIDDSNYWDLLENDIDAYYNGKVNIPLDKIKNIVKTNDVIISKYILKQWKKYMADL